MRIALIDYDDAWYHAANAGQVFALEQLNNALGERKNCRTGEQFGHDYAKMMMSTTTYSWDVTEEEFYRLADLIPKALELMRKKKEEANVENNKVREDKPDGVAEETGEKEST